MSGRAYRIQVAAQVSGVKEPLIRAWERRYGVLHPSRTPSGYRTYSDADIEVLKRLKQLTEEGVAIAQAVKLLPTIRREAKEATLAATSPLKVPRASQLQRWHDEILLAAEKLDQQRIEAVLDEAIASTPGTVFYDELLAPLLKEVGDRWHGGTLSVAEEHLISQAARQRLIVLLAAAPRRAKHHVVCACPPDDQHELGLLGAALHFRHAGWRVTFLGARTPVEQLVKVVRGLKPELVAISVIDATGVPDYLNQLSRELPEKTRVVLGGASVFRHRALAAKLGFRVAEPGDEWVDMTRVAK